MKKLQETHIWLARRLERIVKWFKWKTHKHTWHYMHWDEWQKMGGFGTPTNVCKKCGERRNWCDT